MTKTEIIKAVSATTCKSIAVSEEIINAFLIKIQKEVAKGGTVEIKNFGVFKLVHKEERKGRNPQTNEEITIPAHNAPQFSPGKIFREIVNDKRALPETKKAPAAAEAE